MMDVKARYYLLKLLEEFGRSLAAHREPIGHSKVHFYHNSMYVLCLAGKNIVTLTV